MRLDRIVLAFAFFALTTASTEYDPADALALSDESSDGAVNPTPRKGTLDAPVDGKDGKPHQGPHIETEAERTRKKSKTSGAVATSDDSDDFDGSYLGPDGKPIPQLNDGVMDDPNRLGPKEGTRGTEGGVSAKSKENKDGAEKRPEKPKEAPPLPQSEQEEAVGGGYSADESDSGGVLAEGDGLLQKPEDLPEKPFDADLPRPPSQSDDDSLEDIPHPPDDSSATTTDQSWLSLDNYEPEGKVISPIHSFILSFTMILFSEIGDKTFLVAALMAMRHSRLLVFSAAFTALIVMTVLSAFLGHTFPSLLPSWFTKFMAGVLFLTFGAKMFKEGRAMSPDEGVSEEMKEVEMELEEKEHIQRRRSRRRSSISPYALEAGRAGRKRSSNRLPSPPESASSDSSRESSPVRGFTVESVMTGMSNLCSYLLSPAWVQTFAMTFLGEWGDRSQIATIAMAAGQDYWWVTMGAVIGHGLCTGAAVLGGRAIAGRVSLRAVTLGGACAFFVFGILYLIEAIY
ncbi:hypothetical protein VTN49DRAFT_1904 [Thermomyces lanuginosus]|uniref:uncharacterized protein n=1 Tax=Thermomyces lanuginosus TaxID=5541 RepID=UPI0037427686